MQVRMGLLRKKAEWDTKAFRRHWLDCHGALARQLPGLRGYVQNHVVDREQWGVNSCAGPKSSTAFRNCGSTMTQPCALQSRLISGAPPLPTKATSSATYASS